jgi:hypothetical protein
MTGTPALLVWVQRLERFAESNKSRQETVMEARADYREARTSKGLVALVVVSIALGLGAMTLTTLTKTTGAPAAVTQTHFVQSQAGPAVANPARRGGTQIVPDYSAPTPGSRPAAPLDSTKPGYF